MTDTWSNTGRGLRTYPSLLLASCLLILTVRLVITASEFDPYSILGVSRSASQAEIKRAYKNLAREWHPDKNKDPKAEDMFIKISKSYEILSNEERRSNYDRYGQMDENQPFGQSQHHGFRKFHNSFYFDESFFHFPRSREFADSKYMLHHAQFNSDVLPDSYKRPYLIKVTSEWCFECMHIEPVWKETVQELEPLGVGFGIVDLGYERRLANQLGAYRAPSIIGLANGRITFFHQAVVREHLQQFLEALLPQNLVERVTRINDNNYLAFLDGWHSENKPRVLLFDQVPVVSLLYKLTAFTFRDYVRFGYVDQGASHNPKLLQQFNLNTYAPTMLLFKEHTEKPVDIIQARGMKRQLMDEFVSNNKFLQVPRLVSQQLFNELCPVKQFHRRRKYCVLLITGEDEAFLSGNKAFLDFASANKKDVLRFAYVYQRQQQPLCRALLHNQAVASAQVVVLERRSLAGRVMYRSVSRGWNGSEEDKHHLHQQLELLQKDPSYLTLDATLPELNNEMAPVRPTPMSDDLREIMPLLSLVFSALFILFGTVIIQAFSEPGESKPHKSKRKEQVLPPLTFLPFFFLSFDPCSRPPKKDFVEVTELTDITYISNLVKLRPGHINVVLVLTNICKNALLRKFAKEVFSFSGTETLHFSFLNADKHREWMPSLLRSACYVGQSESLDDEESSDYSGHVLALNGYKKYFCLFRPVFTGDDPNNSSSESSVSSDIHHKLDKLGMWMERLMEGTLPRLHVSAWPTLDDNSSTES
uniref:DnaJ homolog subfamily C member 16 n=1 Tax=Nothobranchius furzeri TaxID=105023 RepID=A0A8C6PAN4_NOTFU